MRYLNKTIIVVASRWNKSLLKFVTDYFFSPSIHCVHACPLNTIFRKIQKEKHTEKTGR